MREREKETESENESERKRETKRERKRERNAGTRKRAGAWRKAARKSRKAGYETSAEVSGHEGGGWGAREGVIKGVNINTGEFSPRGRSWRDGTRARRFRTARSRSLRYLRSCGSGVGGGGCNRNPPAHSGGSSVSGRSTVAVRCVANARTHGLTRSPKRLAGTQ